MQIIETSLEGVKLIELEIFRDDRGMYIETYNEESYKENGIDIDFVQDDCSISDENVLRGIHGDHKTWKLISCLQGCFTLVVVNCRIKDKNFGKWESFNFICSNDIFDNYQPNKLDKFKQILIPPGYGNAHLCIDPTTIFHYKQSTNYDRKSQFTYRYNEPLFDIKWEVDDGDIILSERDKNAEFIKR